MSSNRLYTVHLFLQSLHDFSIHRVTYSTPLPPELSWVPIGSSRALMSSSSVTYTVHLIFHSSYKFHLFFQNFHEFHPIFKNLHELQLANITSSSSSDRSSFSISVSNWSLVTSSESNKKNRERLTLNKSCVSMLYVMAWNKHTSPCVCIYTWFGIFEFISFILISTCSALGKKSQF